MKNKYRSKRFTLIDLLDLVLKSVPPQHINEPQPKKNKQPIWIQEPCKTIRFEVLRKRFLQRHINRPKERKEE